MANIYRLIFLFFLSFLSFNSSAVETFPANKTYCAGPAFHNTNCGIANSSRFKSLSSALDFMMPLCQAQISPNNINECRRDSDKISYLYSNNWSSRSPNLVYSCPANSYAFGTASVCACSNGFNLKNGQCVDPSYIEPPDPCEGLNEFCAGQFMFETDWEISGTSRPGSVCKMPIQNLVGGRGGTTPRFPGCNRGCSVDTYRGVVHYQSTFDDSWRTSGDGKYNGQSCNSDSKTVTPEEPKPEEPKPKDEAPCKKGEFSGYVNGVKTCVASKAKNTDGTTTKKTNSDGSTTETTSTTTCSNGSCNTTITTVNKNSSGATTGTSTEVVKETEGEFCQKNPASPLCKKSDSGISSGTDGKGEGEEDGEGSEFGGSCSSGFTCERGDAIACAIAKKQHEDSCELNEVTDESVLYQQSKGKDGNVTGDLEGNSTHQFSKIKSNSRFSASSCVQDLNITVWGTSVEIPISKVCPWLSNLGYVLVAVAWIMAAAIVMRGR